MSQKTMFLAGCLLVAWLVVLGIGMQAGPGVQAGADPTPTLAPIPDPVLGAIDLAAVSQIDLDAYPVIPEISEQARLIYLNGVQQGNNPASFVKVGDCMTDHESFLIPVGEGEYDLGEYTSLEMVIDTFNATEPNPFSHLSQAAAGGFNTASVLDSMWANPEFCEAGETPLGCEFRLMQPSIALIMFGTNDVYYLDETQYDYFLRGIVVETIRNGTLPILSTFPLRPEFPEKSVLYNQIVVQIALDYDIPLINLWRALEPLENQGIHPEETTHMTVPADGLAAHFTAQNLAAGFTVRNLVTLQALEAVLAAVTPE